MAATLPADDETQLKALLEKMGLKVDKVKTIKDLVKVLPKVKRKKKTLEKQNFSLIKFAGTLQSICYMIRQTTKDEFDDVDILCHNFFRGLHDDTILETL